MPITVACPNCKATGSVPDEAQGRTIKCKACQHQFLVAPPPPTPPPPPVSEPPPDEALRAVARPLGWPASLRTPQIARSAVLGLVCVGLGLLLGVCVAGFVGPKGGVWNVVGTIGLVAFSLAGLAKGILVVADAIRATARPDQSSPEEVLRAFIGSALGCSASVGEHIHRAYWMGFYLMDPDSRRKLFKSNLSTFSNTMFSWRLALNQEVMRRLVPADGPPGSGPERSPQISDVKLLDRGGGVVEAVFEPPPSSFKLDTAANTRVTELFYAPTAMSVSSVGSQVARVTYALAPFAVATLDRQNGPLGHETRLKELPSLPGTYSVACVKGFSGWFIAGPLFPSGDTTPA